MEFKEELAKLIYKAIEKENINIETIKQFIEVPKEKQNGDFAFPCFRLAKELKKSPIDIANMIKDNIIDDKKLISKIEVVNGFLNFYISQEELVKEAMNKFDLQKEDYGKSNMGNGKKVIVEFSSPNIAKPFHIGHLKTTIIGNSLYKIYDYLGYKTTRINHLGDYGTQFAKLIEAYKRFGNEYDLNENPIDKLTDMYVRINAICEEDENVLEECRATFKKLEDGDEYCTSLWQKFKELSMKEFNRIYDLINVKFDSMNGEAFYSDKMQEVLDILNASGKVTESNGAKIIDLEDVGIKTPCIIQKANGSTIYATRDLAAILYRTRTYDFDKCIYVVGEEQSLHFKQVFAVAKYLGIDEKYLNGLEHVSYGMIKLPEGKMSTRKGNFVKVEDLLNEAMTKVSEIIKDKEIENKDEVAKQVGIGAVIFDDLKDTRTKEQIFDINAATSFNGETGPYVQYTAVRCNSVMEKANYIPNANINYTKLTDEASINVVKEISRFPDIIISAMKKSEPSFISRYVISLAKAYSNFYNQNKVICNDKELQDARLYLTYAVKVTLTNGLKLLGIEVPTKM